MALKDTVIKFFYLDELIRKRETGNNEELARKLKISPRHLYNYLHILEGTGRVVLFSKQYNSYIYKGIKNEK